jgi:formylglycine-generating enzyme required for sulfatase activity
MTVVESPGYTPFEQLQSRGNVGPWSDLYALGGTLVKVMTGETPPKAMDRMRKDPYQELVGRVDLKSRFKNEFLGAIDKALAVDEEERWQDAGEWQAALLGEMVAQPVAATPKHVPVTASACIEAGPGSKKKTNFVPWVVAACMVLGLIAVGKSVSNGKVARLEAASSPKGPRFKEITDPDLVARFDAEFAADEARDAEQRASQAEREKQVLIAQEKAKEEEANAIAERAVEAFIAKEKAKEEAEARADMEKLSSADSKAGEERDFEIAAGVKMTFCWIPPGEFLMGSSVDEVGRGDDEIQHRVTISKGFWLAKTEVTQAQWRAVMGSNPSRFKGDDLPVESVSWDDIAGSGGFLERANRFADGESRFSLPTEAQWEYACRAGTTGAHSGNLDQIAWYQGNAGSKTHSVGQTKANAWGLHDMHGNVWEWCADWYGSYPTGAVADPSGATSSSRRVVRGGSCDNVAVGCRVANRRYVTYPGYGYDYMGFRFTRSSVSQNGR